MVFRNELSPFVFRIYGDIGLRWYGLAYLLGFLIGYVWLRRAAVTQSVAGLTKEKVDALIWYVVVGVFAGGRLGFVAQSPGQLLRDPLFPFKVWEGGMAFFGGLVGVVIALLVFTRRHQVKFWSIADVLTVPAALGLGLGRIANFINAELWGKPTGANWNKRFGRKTSPLLSAWCNWGRTPARACAQHLPARWSISSSSWAQT